MPYIVEKTHLNEVLLLEPKVFSDQRGFFFESFNQREFEKATGLNINFVQDNHSLSGHGVLRGLHFQKQFPQGKLVRVVRGEIFDVALDIRPESPQFGQWSAVRLDAVKHHQLWIPAGFAHGFLVLSEQAEVIYKTTDYWNASDEGAIMWNDQDIGIEWPLTLIQGPPKLSAKDAVASTFKSLV